MNIVLTLIICILSVGCVSNRYHYPKDIRSECIYSVEKARRCIEHAGVSLRRPPEPYYIYKIPGEKKFSDGWGWRSPELGGKWVLGQTGRYNGVYITQIGCDPDNEKDINIEVLIHEAGHYWLLSNYKDGTHNEKFKHCFYRWIDDKD